ncbi:mas-related G-protein coupled receptor member H-like [Candoia aspera]|uniref:mas-related G-protein coupled receptor member H-like n=1 Tax=Candoia aspera TaxID=51853 RepID=UPI002FD8541B
MDAEGESVEVEDSGADSTLAIGKASDVGFIPPGIPWVILVSFLYITYISGLFLVTAISIDRCVSVLFPIWHRCSRPRYLSPAVCALLWIFCFILGGIQNILEPVSERDINYLHCLVTAVVCFPLITTSAVILFIKISLKSKQKKRGRLLVMIFISLLCFLILTVPLYITVVIDIFFDNSYFFGFPEFDYYFNLCACLNSSVNPVIYFLVGRKKQCQSKESLKVIFQRLFKEG